MREKLNENPMMQLAVIGVLVVVVGFIFITRMKSSSDSGTATDPTAAATSTTPAATDPTTGAPATTDPAAAAATDPAAAAAGTTPTDGSIPAAAPPLGATTTAPFTAGPGLPKPVVDAYDKGGAVVLLVTKQKGFDDKHMRRAISSIRGNKDVDLFSIRVRDIADYSRIAQGVDLDRVPALVVIQPKKLAGKGQPPTATISYGYRDANSIAQAVEDQLYNGKTLTYAPK